MSSTLVWEPIVKVKNHALPDELKFLLRKITEETPVNKTFDRDDINYLLGLKDAGIKGVGELIEAILQHEAVKVSEEY